MAQTRSHRIASLDLAKFVLSIMVVAIHVSPVSSETRRYLLPVLRIAVPMFYLISSYFLFRKLDNAQEEDKPAILLSFIKRQALLYVSWLVILGYPTFLYRFETYSSWFSDGLLSGIIHFILSVLFSSTFKASWFLSAGIVASVVLYFLNRKHFIYFLVPIICLIVACSASNYYNIVPDLMRNIIRLLSRLGSPYNSFPVAIFWMAVGRELAAIDFFKNGHGLSIPRRTLYAIVLIGLASLYAERAVISVAESAKADDCYYSLPLIVIPLFILLLTSSSISISDSTCSFMRSCSTITYCCHATLAFLLTDYVLPAFQIQLPNPLLFLTVLFACWIITALILFLQSRGLSCLKYLH